MYVHTEYLGTYVYFYVYEGLSSGIIHGIHVHIYSA